MSERNIATTKAIYEAVPKGDAAAVFANNDPEIHVNILDLGLIYVLDIDQQGNVQIEMTLTAPACPVAGTFPGVVEGQVRQVPGLGRAVLDDQDLDVVLGGFAIVFILVHRCFL